MRLETGRRTRQSADSMVRRSKSRRSLAREMPGAGQFWSR